MAGIADEGTAVGEHAHEGAQHAQGGQGLHLLLHALLLIQEPPGGTHLNLALHAALLEIAQHGAHGVVGGLVQAVQDGLGQLALGILQVHQAGQVVADGIVDDGVKAHVRPVAAEHSGVVVAHGPDVVLLHPAPLGVHGAQARQQHGAVAFDVLLLHILPGHGGVEGLVRLLEGGLAPGHGVHAMVGNARAAYVEVFHPALQGGEHVGGGVDLHARHPGKLANVIRKARPVDVDGLVGPESGVNLGFQAVPGGDGLVEGKVVHRVVGGAEVVHVEFVDQGLGAEIVALQHFGGQIVNHPGGVPGEGRVNIEYPLQFQMRPVIQGIADGVGNGVGKGDEFFPGVAVAPDQLFIHAPAEHGAPFVVIPAQHQLGDVVKFDVLGDFTGGKMAMIVDNRHILGGFMI